MLAAQRVINHVEELLAPDREEVFISDIVVLALLPDDLGIKTFTILMVTHVGQYLSNFEVSFDLFFSFGLNKKMITTVS